MSVFLSLCFRKSIFLEAAIFPFLQQVARFSGTERARKRGRVTKAMVCSYPVLKNLRDGSVQMACRSGSHMLDALSTILYRHGSCQETAREKKKKLLFLKSLPQKICFSETKKNEGRNGGRGREYTWPYCGVNKPQILFSQVRNPSCMQG